MENVKKIIEVGRFSYQKSIKIHQDPSKMLMTKATTVGQSNICLEEHSWIWTLDILEYIPRYVIELTDFSILER